MVRALQLLLHLLSLCCVGSLEVVYGSSARDRRLYFGKLRVPQTVTRGPASLPSHPRSPKGENGEHGTSALLRRKWRLAYVPKQDLQSTERLKGFVSGQGMEMTCKKAARRSAFSNLHANKGLYRGVPGALGLRLSAPQATNPE